MGLDELIARLQRDVDARVAVIEARATGEMEAIARAANQASSRARDEALAERRAQRRSRLDREMSDARRDARADRLHAEYALLDRVMARVATLLDEAEGDPAYVSTLPERVAQALSFVEGHPSRVRCRPSLAGVIRGAIAGCDGVTIEEVPDVAPGFSVVACDGSVEVDDTLAARVERLRPQLLIELLTEVDR